MRKAGFFVGILLVILAGSVVLAHPARADGTGIIIVKVFRDNNGNASWDAGEPGVAGATVRILYRLSQPAGQKASGGSGDIIFSNLQPGAYLVQLLRYPGGYVPSTGRAATIILQANQGRYVYFGLKPAAAPTPTPTPIASSRADFTASASVCIKSWNGSVAVLRYAHTVRNVGSGAGSVPVHLTESFNGQGGGSTMYWTSSPTITLGPGQTWSFGRDVTISNWVWTGMAASETWPNKYRTAAEANPNNNRASTGFIYPDWCGGAAPRVYGFAFLDRNGNGRRDPGEPRANITVQLWQAGYWKGNASPSGSGYWAFAINRIDLARGRNFAVAAVAPAGARFTTPNRYFVNVGRTGTFGPYLFGITAASTPTPTPTRVLPTPTPTATPTPPPECWPSREWTVETPPQASVSYSPRYPVVVGQGGSGFSVEVSATGGHAEKRRKEPQKRFLPGGGWEWVCVERVVARADHPLVEVAVTAGLSADSQQWIEQQLASRYYGATVRDPGTGGVIFSGSTMSWRGGFAHGATDPGLYVGEVRLRFRGSSLSPGDKVLVRPFAVPVYMIDTRLER